MSDKPQSFDESEVPKGRNRDVDEINDWHLTERVEHDVGRGDPFAAAVRATRMPMCITDPRLEDNPIVFANDAFQRLTGYERDEVLGRNCRFLQGAQTDPENVRKVRDAIENRQSVQVTLLNYRKDGSTFWNELYLSPVQLEDGTLQFYFASQVDVTDRVEAAKSMSELNSQIQKEVDERTEELQRALDQKVTLLAELDHRVKNNLATISALARMQVREEEGRARSGLEKLHDRINTIAMVHNTLFSLDRFDGFDVGSFSESLVRELLQSAEREDIVFHSDIEPVPVAARKATSIGLALNELITTSIKHAFASQAEPRLSLSVRADDEDAVVVLSDNGRDEGAAPSGDTDGGASLVQRLLVEIDGSTEWSSTAEGTSVELRFPTEFVSSQDGAESAAPAS